MKCKIRVIKEILELFPECRPEVGKVYDAEYHYGHGSAKDAVVINVGEKKILLRIGEFEMVEA